MSLFIFRHIVCVLDSAVDEISEALCENLCRNKIWRSKISYQLLKRKKKKLCILTIAFILTNIQNIESYIINIFLLSELNFEAPHIQGRLHFEALCNCTLAHFLHPRIYKDVYILTFTKITPPLLKVGHFLKWCIYVLFYLLLFQSYTLLALSTFFDKLNEVTSAALSYWY